MTDLELNVAVAEFLGVTIRTDPRTGAQWVDVDGGPFRPATSLDDAMAATDHAFGKDAEVGVMRRNFSGSECGTEFWCANLHKDAELVLSAWGSTGPRALCRLIVEPSRHRTASEIGNIGLRADSFRGGYAFSHDPKTCPACQNDEARIRQIVREELDAREERLPLTDEQKRLNADLFRLYRKADERRRSVPAMSPEKAAALTEAMVADMSQMWDDFRFSDQPPASPGPETPPDPIRTFFNLPLGD
jgi:hypothetical protein